MRHLLALFLILLIAGNGAMAGGVSAGRMANHDLVSGAMMPAMPCCAGSEGHQSAHGCATCLPVLPVAAVITSPAMNATRALFGLEYWRHASAQGDIPLPPPRIL